MSDEQGLICAMITFLQAECILCDCNYNTVLPCFTCPAFSPSHPSFILLPLPPYAPFLLLYMVSSPWGQVKSHIQPFFSKQFLVLLFYRSHFYVSVGVSSSHSQGRGKKSISICCSTKATFLPLQMCH